MLEQKRDIMLSLREQYPIHQLCAVLDLPRSTAYAVLDLPRSTAYYEPRPSEDRPLLEALIAVAGQWPTYGYRRLTKQPQREGHIVNSKVRATVDARTGNRGKSPGKEASDDGQRPRLPALSEPRRGPWQFGLA